MIYPVILSGGVGTRLWPLSRKSYPKQFAPIVGDRALFQECALRLTGTVGYDAFASPVVVTHSDFRFIVTEQLAEVGIDPGAILLEPESRNTASAVLAAAQYITATDPDGIILVAPSDHVVRDHDAFRAAIAKGLEAVRQRRIVTFGITPDRAEPGYGYLGLPAVPDGSGAATELVRFVEKPDARRAAKMIGEGTYLWNAGIFLFRARDMVTAFETHAPDIIEPVTRALDFAKHDLGFLRLAPEPWAELEDVSIDYAIMERADNLSVVPLDSGWSDVGDWEGVWRELDPDGVGVVTDGAATAIDCTDTLLRSEDERVEVVGIGLEGIIAVAMPDAVLVADKSRSQDVKLAIEALTSKAAPQATMLPKDHRPWGWFESLVVGPRFQVKRILVHPGAALSLQSHVHRAEHWVVVEGTARVTVEDEVKLLTENQSVFIPLGSRHRLENPGRVPMVLIEVQTGAYVGEDDIVRYEDVYAREDGN